LQRLETSEGGTTIKAFFNNFTPKETCFTIQFIQQCTVENLKKATVEVTDVYSTGLNQRRTN
jgi:hypothetical protein